MTGQENVLNWFEVPATDINRAQKFYEAVFDIQMQQQEMMGMIMSFFPFEMSSGKLSGALVQGPMHKPSDSGTIIYFNANPSIQTVIDRIETAGGKLLMPRTQITEEIGYMAFFRDTEGNTVALHAEQ